MNKNIENIIKSIKPPKTTVNNKLWNKKYVGMVYKELKPVHQLIRDAKHVNDVYNGDIEEDNFIIKTSRLPINKLEVPMTLREAIDVYSKDGESLGLNPKHFVFAENFAYLLAVMYFKNIRQEIVHFNNEIEILPGVYLYNKQTENAMKVKKYAKELAIAEDYVYNEIDKRKNIVTASNKRKQLKEAIARWFQEMAKFDRVNAIIRQNKILKK